MARPLFTPCAIAKPAYTQGRRHLDHDTDVALDRTLRGFPATGKGFAKALRRR
jgi:hypothetical protein